MAGFHFVGTYEKREIYVRLLLTSGRARTIALTQRGRTGERPRNSLDEGHQGPGGGGHGDGGGGK